MAVTADRVVVELEARLGQYDAQVKASAAAFDASMKQTQASAVAAETAITGAAAGASTALGKTATQAKGAQAALKGLSGQTGNLAAQFNDIGVQLAGGQSPFLIALQQGSQINQVLAQAGGSGASFGALLRGAFASMINPASLATFAIIGIGGALLQYGASVLDETESANDALKNHADVIRRIKDAYGEAAAGLTEYSAESESVLAAAARKNLGSLQELAKQANAELVKALGSGVAFPDADKAAFAPFKASIDALIESARNGKPDLDAFNQSIDATFNAGLADAVDPAAFSNAADAVKAIGQSALEASSEFAPFADAIAALKASIESGNPDLVTFQTNVDAISNANDGELRDLGDTVLDLGSAAVTAQRGVNAAEAAISAIGGAAGAQIGQVQALSAALKELSGLAVAAMSDTNLADAAYKKGIAASGGDEKAQANVERAYNAALVRIGNQIAGANVPVPVDKPSQLGDNPPRAARSGGGGRRSSLRAGGGGGGSKIDTFGREVDQIEERTKALQEETAIQASINPLVNDFGFAITKAQIARDLLNAAEKEGTKVTPELQAKIDALATGYANAKVGAEQLADSQEKVQQASEEFNQLGKDVVGGVISDLRNGKSAAEALAGALDKVIDKLIEVALNAAFDSGGGGGLGGLLSGLGSLLGFGRATGGPVSAGKLYPVGERGPELFAPGRSGTIIPNNAITMPSLPQGRSAIQRVTENRNVTVDVTGANGDKQIMEMVQRGVAAGIGQYDRQLNRTIGGKQAAWQAERG